MSVCYYEARYSLCQHLEIDVYLFAGKEKNAYHTSARISLVHAHKIGLSSKKRQRCRQWEQLQIQTGWSYCYLTAKVSVSHHAAPVSQLWWPELHNSCNSNSCPKQFASVLTISQLWWPELHN